MLALLIAVGALASSMSVTRVTPAPGRTLTLVDPKGAKLATGGAAGEVIVNAQLFDEPMDPSDQLDWTVNLTQGDTADAVLQTGEGVASFSIAGTVEASAAGIELVSGGGYGTTIDQLAIQFWLAVDSTAQPSSVFDGDGLTVGFEVNIVTTSAPPRHKQRTVFVQVANQ